MVGPGLVFIIAGIALFGTLFGYIYLRSRENMAMLDRGMNPRQKTRNSPKPFVNLKYGLLLCGAGFGLLLAFLLDTYLPHHIITSRAGDAIFTNEKDFTPLYFALIGLCGGLGLVISYRIEKKEWFDKEHFQKADTPINIL